MALHYILLNIIITIIIKIREISISQSAEDKRMISTHTMNRRD